KGFFQPQLCLGVGVVASADGRANKRGVLRLARRAGLEADAFPTDWQVLPTASPWWESLTPSVGALAASGIAIREYLAWAFDYRSVAVKS
ncbi:MAG TPA: hypothetical protein VLL30_09080, partial [Reyranella sp.]|nr:hypothetical protein [Reyranella sp.]